MTINTVNCFNISNSISVNSINIFYNYDKEDIDTVQVIEVPCGSGSIYRTQWDRLAWQIVELSISDPHSGESMAEIGDQFGSSDGKYGYKLISEDGEIILTGCYSNEAIVDLTSLPPSECDNRIYVLKEIGNFGMFATGSVLESIKIPNTVTKIGDNNLRYLQKLRRIEFPNSVKYIGPGYFYCDSLHYVSFGRGLTDLPYSVFMDAPNIDTVVCRALVPPICDTNSHDHFEQSLSSAVLLVPCQSVSLYQNAPMWSGFANIQCLPDLPMDTVTVTIQKGTKYSFYGEDYRLAGVYTVDLDDSVHTLILSVTEDAGLNDIEEYDDIIVYPVPAKNKLTLYFNNTVYYDNIQIHNLNGALVYQSKIDCAQNIVEIDVSKLPSGAYILTISNDKSIVTKKIIIN